MLNRFWLYSLCLVSLFSMAQSSQDSEEANSGGSEQVRYITDDLFTFVHAGPGRNYRILGSVVAGSRVTLLDVDEESNFAQLIDDKGRTGWVEGRFVVPQPSLRAQIPALSGEVEAAQKQHQQLRIENARLSEELARFSEQQNDKDSIIERLQQENAQLTEQLIIKEGSEMQTWMIKGGVLAIGSLLIGVILSLVFKGRRRNGWM
jgi:SH3 domain protein